MNDALSTMQLQLKDGVHVLTLTNGDNDNTFTLDVVKEYLQVLDCVEAYTGNTALMISCEHEKTWCNGINLEVVIAGGEQYMLEFRQALETMFYRLATLNAPTLACVNGNVYAGGAILFAACDFRFMRADRGRVCFPEVDIQIPFTPMMYDIIDGITSTQATRRMLLLGEKITGEEALNLGIVDEIHPVTDLYDEAFEFARRLTEKHRATYSEIKLGIKPGLRKWHEHYKG